MQRIEKKFRAHLTSYTFAATTTATAAAVVLTNSPLFKHSLTHTLTFGWIIVKEAINKL
jgi:hypothetical protein